MPDLLETNISYKHLQNLFPYSWAEFQCLRKSSTDHSNEYIKRDPKLIDVFDTDVSYDGT